MRKDGEIEIDISKDMRLDTDREAEVILGNDEKQRMAMTGILLWRVVHGH